MEYVHLDRHAWGGSACPDPKKVRRGVVAGILAAALAGTTGAVAAGWTAHTGVEADGSTEMGSGELIRLDASDLDQVLVRLSQGIPFPSAASFDRAKENISQVEPTQTSTSGLRSALTFNAACEWTGSWIDAFHDGDETAMSAAQAVLDEIPTWSSISGGGMASCLNCELRVPGSAIHPSSSRNTKSTVQVAPQAVTAVAERSNEL